MKLFITAVSICITLLSHASDIKQELTNLFGNKIKELPKSDHFEAKYEIQIQQILDHTDSSKGYFTQYIYVYHSGFDRPTHIETEGYNAYTYTREIPKLVKGNQIMIEYRYYGKSVPKPLEWKYLTNDNAIEDIHGIVTKLKTIYKGKFLASGVSKGGETTIIYKSKYPNDVDLFVPYVAPLINGREDKRTDKHIKTTGTKAERDSILAFQRRVLTNRTAILKEIEVYKKESGNTFAVGENVALEYAVLEFPFSYWQWGGKFEDIPGKNSTPKQQFDYIHKLVGIDFYCDATIKRLYPSFYQHMRELGYYGFDIRPVKDLLTEVFKPTNEFFAPKNTDLTYNKKYIKTVRKFLKNEGNNMMYIYGELDTWGACGVYPSKRTNSVRFDIKGGSHSARIKHLTAEQKKLVYKYIEEKLNCKVEEY